MSIYIPGMEMPKSCHDCRFCGWSNFWQSYDCHMTNNRALLLFNGEKTNSDSRTRNGRADNCPLIHVPPHGRLKDADALSDMLNKYKHEYALEAGDKKDFGIMQKAFGLHDAELMVESLPTILPAEGGEA